jgi:hypothetical protein
MAHTAFSATPGDSSHFFFSSAVKSSATSCTQDVALTVSEPAGELLTTSGTG